MSETQQDERMFWSLLPGVSVGFITGVVGTLSYFREPSLIQILMTGALISVLGALWQALKFRMKPTLGFVTLFTMVMGHTWLITFQAMPAPGGGMNKRDWKSETVQGEFKAWTERLNSVGFAFEQEELESFLWDAATTVMIFRRQSLAPMRRYYRNSGTWQSWRMFVAPHRYPSRLHIDLRTAGKWEPLYVARSLEHDWNAQKLDHDRFRAGLFRYGWGRKYPREWLGFGDWIGREAARDFPDADAVRLRFWSYRTLSPEETRRGEKEVGKWIRTRIVRLGGDK